ncbi:MAG: acyltransferase [Clostridia bacterium]|nr:acyltransferase [Clostridia bacterium]
MNLKSDSLFWKKKEFISFILSILVFFIHSNFAQDSASGSLISVINQKTSFFFSSSITQFAVPMFFMLSGITFFKEYDNTKYLTKIKSRLFTLIVPYLLWNTIWLVWEIFSSYSFISKFSSADTDYSLTLTNVLKGVFFYGCNQPFWFMFNLIIFSLAAPIVYFIIKNKYIAFASIITLSVLALFGIHIPTSVFYYPNSIIFYLIGATIGYHYFDFISKKSSRKTQIVSIALLSAYILAKNILPQELHIDNYLTEVIMFTLCAFALWNVADIFIEKIKPRAIYRRSFAIYAMHLNVAIIILKVLNMVLPQSEWLEIPKFIIMVVLTLIIINLVCSFLERFLPKIYAVLMGNRVKKQ